MIINKSYKFRLYPNKEQQELINKTLGCNRLVYNYYLNKKKEEYENNNKNITCYECIKNLTKIYADYPFLKEIDSISLRCSLLI
jgi:putative transposase